MEDSSEVSLKTLCCTCLSRERKLFQLCRLADGVNNLYLLLSYDSEAYKEGFYKNTASLFICWECKAVMASITRFRIQACSVQRQLTDIVDGRIDVKFLNACLSRLTVSTKRNYDSIITEADIVADNFIDCGPVADIKIEDDFDDIPLSELHNNSISDAEELLEDLEQPKAKVKMKKKKKKLKCLNKNELSVNSVKDTMKMDEEIIENNQETIIESDLFKCEYCGDIFNSDIDLQKHSVLHIQNNKNCKAPKSGTKPRRNPAMLDKRTPNGYMCPECNKYFDTKNKRWKHVQRYHREGYACVTCGKRFAFKNNLSRHEQLHVSPPPREECPQCHKLIRSDLIKMHSRIHSLREQFTCVECDKRFVSRASYEHHLKYTRAHAANAADILKYKCGQCDKGYRSRGELRDHVNYQHMGRTQHQCPICGKALATRRCITRHVRRAHDGRKESARDKVCQLCGKAFRDKKGLREHEFIHTGERPLSCEICGCTFRQSASLYTHKKRVHKIYPQKKNVEILDTS